MMDDWAGRVGIVDSATATATGVGFELCDDDR